jgi:hypothetical protein
MVSSADHTASSMIDLEVGIVRGCLGPSMGPVAPYV